MLQEGTKSDVAHIKIRKKVLAAFHLLFAFGLEQYLFQKVMSVKPPNPVAERLGMEWFCLCSASCNDTCLSLCLSSLLCTSGSLLGIITSVYIFTYWCLNEKHMQWWFYL